MIYPLTRATVGSSRLETTVGKEAGVSAHRITKNAHSGPLACALGQVLSNITEFLRSHKLIFDPPPPEQRQKVISQVISLSSPAGREVGKLVKIFKLHSPERTEVPDTTLAVF